MEFVVSFKSGDSPPRKLTPDVMFLFRRSRFGPGFRRFTGGFGRTSFGGGFAGRISAGRSRRTGPRGLPGGRGGFLAWARLGRTLRSRFVKTFARKHKFVLSAQGTGT